MGLFDNSKKNNNSSNRRINTSERSCFDCKHCNASKMKDEQIFCRWDSEYYYPETGISCIDFNK